MNLSDPGFFITYSLLQFLVLLLLIRSMDPYEREPWSMIALMALWGSTGAIAIGLAGNRWLAGRLASNEEVAHVFGAALSAPIVEEVGKGVALVLVVIGSRWAARRFGTPEFDGVTDGVVYGAAVGLGFAFTENVFYFMQTLHARAVVDLSAALEVFNARSGFLASNSLGHAVYTGTFGAALGLACWARKRRARYGYPVAGLLLAVVMHACYNGLEQLILVSRFGLNRTDAYFQAVSRLGLDAPPPGFEDVWRADLSAIRLVGALDKAFLAAFFVMIVMWLAYQRRVIHEELIESAEAGLLTMKEAQVMPRYWRRSRWYMHVLSRAGFDKLRLLRQIHGTMVTLALTKRRLRKLGYGPEWQRVDRLWAQITGLKRAVRL